MPEIQTIDLNERLDHFCGELGFDRPPKIVWSNEAGSKFAGTYNFKRHVITINPAFNPEFVDTVIVHELCHAVLFRVGYTCVGHSAIFLSTYQLMLDKVGLSETDNIEQCAVANWNKWIPWPHWYRHVFNAQEIYAQFCNEGVDLSALTAAEIANKVLRTKQYSKYVPKWFIYRWHEVIADTRGNWYAMLLSSQGLMFSSFGLMMFIQTKIVVTFASYAMFIGAGGCWLFAKVLRLDTSQLTKKLMVKAK